MENMSRSVTVTVANPQGMHLRPLDMFVRLANQFKAKIEVLRAGERLDAKSMLTMMTLAAVQGTQLRIEATGPDADAAIHAMADLVARGFGEMEGTPAPNAPATRPAGEVS